jgi:xanthine dehydrogenase iron-sulfur cluster and FAD-binding subunit A
VAVRCDFDTDGTVTDAAIALGSVAPTIVRSGEAEAAVMGGRLSNHDIAGAARAAAASVTPIDDIRAPATYRSDLLPTMITRALVALRDDTAVVAESPVTLGGPRVVADGNAVVADSTVAVTASMNGTTVSAPWTSGSLLDWLRSVGSAGTKEGCAEGECGACTVHLDGVAVLSCLVPAGRGHGADIATVEGLAEGEALHPVQQRFIDEAAVQCGYCIPGFMMAGAALMAERPRPTPDEVRLGLSGNLCRCTGYYAINAAFDEGGRP